MTGTFTTRASTVSTLSGRHAGIVALVVGTYLAAGALVATWAPRSGDPTGTDVLIVPSRWRHLGPPIAPEAPAPLGVCSMTASSQPLPSAPVPVGHVQAAPGLVRPTAAD